MDLARGRGPWLLAWLAVAPIVALRAGTLAESDTFWQTRTGELILDLGRLPTADPFSWTAAGHPWTVNSWGFDVLLAWAYRSGGLPGIALAGAVLAFLAAGLVLLVARRLGAGPLAATVVVQGAALAQLTFLSVRPQLVDYCVIPVLVLLTRGVTRPAAQLPARLVGLGALATVWVNLHSTAVMGVPLLAAAAVATAVWRPAALGRVGAALAVYTLGVMVNPAGPQILAQAVTVARESTGLITEWSRPELTSPAVVAGLVAAAAAAVVTWRSRDPLLFPLLALPALGSLVWARMLPVAVLLAAAVLPATRLPRLVLPERPSRTALPTVKPVVVSWGRRGVLSLAIALALVCALLAGGLAAGLGRPDPATYPAVAVTDRLPPRCHVLNSYLLGGWLELVRPDLLVSVDSRNDVFGAEQVRRNEAAVTRSAGDLAADTAGADCVVVPATAGLATRLRSAPGWRLVAQDAAAVAFVRG